MNIQLQLQNELVRLEPLDLKDLDILYKVASDPLIWEQHPNKDRYKKEVFDVFFRGAIESKGAYKICNAQTGKIIGSTRYYGLDVEKSSINIGYTFLARSHWGGKYNPAVKRLMISHALDHVNTIHFHIGAVNVRSQKAIERLGATKIGEMEMEYYGETAKLNYIYSITKLNWQPQNK